MKQVASLFALLLVAACSSSEETPEPLTRQDFCASWAESACTDQTVSACQAASVEQCRAAQESFCLTLLPQDFSGERADACLSAVKAAYDDADLTADELKTVLRLDAPCNTLVRGTKGRGETCTQTADCDAAGGYECVIRGGDVSGTCQVPEEVAAGFSCKALQQVCAEGFYCNGSNCIASKEVGDDCTTHQECGTAGYCGADGFCTARLDVDTACDADVQCESGLCYEFSTGDRTCVDRLRLSRSEPICANLR